MAQRPPSNNNATEPSPNPWDISNIPPPRILRPPTLDRSPPTPELNMLAEILQNQAGRTALQEAPVDSRPELVRPVPMNPLRVSVPTRPQEVFRNMLGTCEEYLRLARLQLEARENAAREGSNGEENTREDNAGEDSTEEDDITGNSLREAIADEEKLCENLKAALEVVKKWEEDSRDLVDSYDELEKSLSEWKDMFHRREQEQEEVVKKRGSMIIRLEKQRIELKHNLRVKSKELEKLQERYKELQKELGDKTESLRVAERTIFPSLLGPSA